MKKIIICTICAFLFTPLFAHASLVSTSVRTRLTESLLHHWTFDGPDFISTVLDRGSDPKALTVTNYTDAMTARATGKLGQGIACTGGTRYVASGGGSPAPHATAFSATMWVKFKGNTGASIFDWGNRFARFDGVTAHKINFSVDGGSSGSATTATSLDDDKWHFLAFTSSASSQIIYVDGVQEGVATETYSATAAGITICNSSGGSNGNVGLMDDVRVYSKILSASDIKNLYTAGAVGAQANTTVKTRTGLTNGLVGYWTFDGKDVVNGVARDVSGQAHHGNLLSISTSTFYAAGKIGQGFKFDGIDSRVNTGSDFVGTNAMTISLWMKPASFGEGNSGRLVTNQNTTGFFLRAVTTNSRLRFTSNGGANNVHSADNSFVVNKWTHVVVTRDESGLANFYIDGSLSGTANQDSGTPTTGSTNVIIGAHNGAVETFSGLIDDVRIYNRTLSVSEIQQLYAMGGTAVNKTVATRTGLTNGLVGHWTFDGPDIINGVLMDKSGQGNVGSIRNIATTTFYKSGKIGQGIRPDGSNDCIDMGNPSALNITGAVSLSAWVKFSSSVLNRGIVSKSSIGGGTASQQYHLYDGGNNKVSFAVNNGGGTQLTSSLNSSVLAAGKWAHIVGTYDGVDTTRLYWDGALYDTDTSGGYGTLNASGKNLEIANSHGSSTCNGTVFDGQIDDVRVYNRALTANEVLRLYNMGR